MKPNIQIKQLLNICIFIVCAMQIQAQTCLESSLTMQKNPIESQSGVFQATFTATPVRPIESTNVGVGLSQNLVDWASGWACGIRFSYGKIQYVTSTGWTPIGTGPSFTSETTYSLRFVVDVPNLTYSIFIAPEGGSEVSLATNVLMKGTPPSLNYWNLVNISSDLGTANQLTVCDFAIGAPGPTTATPNIALNTNEVNLFAYPNPSSGQTIIKYTLNESGKVALSLYDVSGKQMTIIESGYKEKGVYEKEYDMMAFPKGIYFINLTQEGRSFGSCKLIK